MRLLRAADRTAAPWKNGGGATTEVIAVPHGAGFGDFDWRVSLAEVAASGPFSVFEGVDRWLLVLEGALALSVEGLGLARLSPGEHLAFPGDARTHGQVLDGPVRDLNVMSRRGRIRASAERLDGGMVGGGDQLILALGLVKVGDLVLEPHDAVQLDALDPPVMARGPMVRVRLDKA